MAVKQEATSEPLGIQGARESIDLTSPKASKLQSKYKILRIYTSQGIRNPPI